MTGGSVCVVIVRDFIFSVFTLGGRVCVSCVVVFGFMLSNLVGVVWVPVDLSLGFCLIVSLGGGVWVLICFDFTFSFSSALVVWVLL